MADEKKIIIDEDWKQQAKKEKENLAAKEKTETNKQPGKEKNDKNHRGPLPEGDFVGLLSMLVTQTLFALGYLSIEGQEKKEPDLQIAKYNIEILQTLEDKTKGNLTDEESTALKNMISQVRMAYVKAAE